jgi:Na+/H+-translocating membrane pyrophosphatase
VIGLLIGGVIPFFVAALTMTAVGRAAGGMVDEVRRQFREIPGLMEGTARPDSARCVDISTKAALREMIAARASSPSSRRSSSATSASRRSAACSPAPPSPAS